MVKQKICDNHSLGDPVTIALYWPRIYRYVYVYKISSDNFKLITFLDNLILMIHVTRNIRFEYYLSSLLL